MKRFRDFLITTLIGGVVVLLPLALLIFLVRLIWSLIISISTPIVIFILGTAVPTFWIELLGIAILIAFCFFVGLFVRTKVGGAFFKLVEENLLSLIPFYLTIKEMVQQFTGAKEMPFTKVVSVDVFGTGTRMTGFITDEHQDGTFTVFVPTGPNPTNGFIFHVEPGQIERLKTSTEEAMRSIIGIGVGSDKVLGRKDKTQKK